MNTNRKLAAIMFTDIVGYSALMPEDEKAGSKNMEKYTGKVDLRKITRHNNLWGTFKSLTMINQVCGNEIPETKIFGPLVTLA